jgi:hypothetical protein
VIFPSARCVNPLSPLRARGIVARIEIVMLLNLDVIAAAQLPG